jgi:acetyl esterase
VSYDYDPELRAFLDILPEIDLADPDHIRELRQYTGTAAVAAGDDPGVEVVEGVLAGSARGVTVPFRLYRPAGANNVPGAAVILLHGGGFVVRSVESERARAVEVVRELDAVVLAIDYRLAPEHPYPAALDDAWSALEYLHDRADELQVDRSRIAVVGESAGGALAAGLAIRARDEGGPALCMQALLIPVLDDRLETGSMRRFGDTPMWTRSMAESSWGHYLGSSSTVPSTAAPARVVDLSGLPPTYITCMEFDPLRDEALAYAQRLLDHGVSVELHCYAGGFHGATSIPVTSFARRALDELITVLRRRLASSVETT